jgi:DNA-binding SARP family transcriptional activator
MPRHLTIELFGGLRIRREGAPAQDVSTQQTGALLAILALRAGASFSREELADLIWPDDEASVSRQRLRQRVHTLRHILEPVEVEAGSVLHSTRSAVRLSANSACIDAVQFSTLLEQASKTSDPSARIELLTEAVDLYQGELLPGFYLDHIVAERNRLSLVYRAALGQLVRLLEENGERERAIDVAGRALVVEPLNEEVHCDLMRLYSALGQPSAVTRQFRKLEEILGEELGEAPAEATRQRYDELLAEARRMSWGRTPAETLSLEANGDIPPKPKSPDAVDDGPVSAQGSAAKDLGRGVRRGRMLMALCAVLVLAAVIVGGLSRISKSRSRSTAQVSSTSQVRHVWTYRYSPLHGEKDSEATALVRDGLFNNYVTGFVQTAHNDVDFLTIKLDVYGNQLWHRQYNGTGNDVDRARYIALDNRDDSVYVAGDSDNGKGNQSTRLSGLDVVLIKYSTNGEILWKQRYDDIDGGDDRPRKLLLDKYGNIFVLCGCRRRSGKKDAGQDFVILKYRPDGAREWVQRYDGLAHNEDEPVDMAVESDGSVYVTGSTYAISKSGPELDFMTLKLTPSGKVAWAVPFGNGNLGDDRPKGLRLQPSGGVFVVGDGVGLPGSFDQGRRGCVAVKYSAAGGVLWKRGTQSLPYRLTDVYMTVPMRSGMVISGLNYDVQGVPVCRTICVDSSFSPVWARDTVLAEGGKARALAPAALITTTANNQALLLGDLFDMPRVRSVVDLLDPVGGLIWQGELCEDAGPMSPRSLSGGFPGRLEVVGQDFAGPTRDLIVVSYSRY